MVRRYILFAVSIALCVTVATFTNLPVLVAGNTIPDETAQPPVPIKFSHKLHIKDVGVDCAILPPPPAHCHPIILLVRMMNAERVMRIRSQAIAGSAILIPRI